MKYAKEERLEIGKRVYENEITRKEACEEYGISNYTAREYMRLYRDTYNLPVKEFPKRKMKIVLEKLDGTAGLEELEKMSKDELIQEVIKSRIDNERLKKGYEVKGGGGQREYLPIVKKNSK